MLHTIRVKVNAMNASQSQGKRLFLDVQYGILHQSQYIVLYGPNTSSSTEQYFFQIKENPLILFSQLFGEMDPDMDVSPDTEDPEAAGVQHSR
jgi:hypothetical protein